MQLVAMVGGVVAGLVCDGSVPVCKCVTEVCRCECDLDSRDIE